MRKIVAVLLTLTMLVGTMLNTGFGVVVAFAALTGTTDRASAPQIVTQDTSITLTTTQSYFKIVQAQNGTYTIKTIGSDDSVAELQDAGGNRIASGDDEFGFDFVITQNLNEGQTYYLFVRDYLFHFLWIISHTKYPIFNIVISQKYHKYSI